MDTPKRMRGGPSPKHVRLMSALVPQAASLPSESELLEQMELAWLQMQKQAYVVQARPEPEPALEISAREPATPMWKCARPWARRRKA